MKLIAMTIQMIDPRLLDLSENLREEVDQSSIHAIANSLTLVGMMQPIRVIKRNGRSIVEDGSMRTRGALLLGWTEVPIIIVDDDESEALSLQRQLIANCQRESLAPSDLARGIFRLMEEAKCTAREAAKMIGMSSKVGKLLPLLKLPEGILALVDQGKIPASCAYELSRISDPMKQLELANQIAEGKLTRDGLLRLIKSLGVSQPVIGQKIRRSTVLMDGNRQVTVSAPGLDIASFIDCLDELTRKAKRERARGVELSTFTNMLRDQLQQEECA